jgi:hypothetical protein
MIELQTKFKKCGLPRLLESTIQLVSIVGLAGLSLEDKKEQYTILRMVLIEHYINFTYFDINNEYNFEKQTINEMLKVMYELDEKCGKVCYESETITPEQLELLDADRLKFKTILKKYLMEHLMENKLSSMYILIFAKLLFQFNGYQAYERKSFSQAIRDAHGISDLFGELMDEIKNEANSEEFSKLMDEMKDEINLIVN